MVDNPQSSELNEETRNDSSNENEATSILAGQGSRVLDRRRMLEFTAGGAIALWGGIASKPVAADMGSGGELEWRFPTGRGVFSSPTVVDGTIYVGGIDGHVYALDAGVEGHSEDSRVLLGTLGHHHSWAGVAPPEPPIEEVCVDQIADQDINAGEICVINDNETLSITYTTSDDWELTETHLAVGDDLEEYEDEGWVTPNGQPRPGRFPYSDDHGPTDEVTYDGISLEGRADKLVVAAHAVVEREINDEIQEEGAWGNGEQFADRGGWAMYFEYEVQ